MEITDFVQLLTATVLSGIFGAWCTINYIQHVNKRILREHTEELVETMLSDFKEHFIRGYSERSGDIIRLYDIEDDKFLVQGTNLQELVDAWEERFPDQRLIVARSDDELNAMIEVEN